jgi:hypothetical protein
MALTTRVELFDVALAEFALSADRINQIPVVRAMRGDRNLVSAARLPRDTDLPEHLRDRLATEKAYRDKKPEQFEPAIIGELYAEAGFGQ